MLIRHGSDRDLEFRDDMTHQVGMGARQRLVFGLNIFLSYSGLRINKPEVILKGQTKTELMSFIFHVLVYELVWNLFIHLVGKIGVRTFPFMTF